MLTGELLAKVRKIEIKTRKLVEEITGGAYHSVSETCEVCDLAS